jgi:aldehyde dehydrogenase (NAD+)
MTVNLLQQRMTTPADSAQGDIARVFAAQLAVAQRLRTSTPAERVSKLKALRSNILAQRDAIIAAGAADFRRPALEVEMFELMPVIMDISHTCKRLERWLKPRKVRATSMTLGTSAWVRYEPRGRCLIMAPWNYPLTLTFGELVAAVACGNTSIVKTSEVAAHFSAVIADIIRKTFPEDEVAVVEGDAAVATALLRLPFDHMFFTGSPEIGRVVMAAAAKHLSSVTLELGGKCPTIVDETADIALAVKTIAWAKFANSGQTCIAPDHIYVQASVADEFLRRFKALLDELYGENDQAKTAPLARIINGRHTRRIADLLDDAKRRGAKVLYGGAVDESERFVAPTLLGKVPADARIMQEEIFGPLLPIIEYSRIDEVMGRINAAPKPLALYIWSNDKARGEYIVAHSSAGSTCINHQSIQF